MNNINMMRAIRSVSAPISKDIQASVLVAAEISQETVTRSIDAVQHIHYDQLPEWMKVDPHIRLGYRRQLNSFHDCFWSLFYLHNESVNIWSHLLPAFCYLAFSLGLYLETFHSGIQIPAADAAFFQVCVLSTAGCLLLSALYHCTNSHSEHISKCFLKFDYLGILLSITGTNASAAYFGLYDDPFLQASYVVFFPICATLVFVILLRYDLDGPCAVLQRAGIIVALASTGLAPFIHTVSSKGTEEAHRRFAVEHTAAMVLLDLIACSFYTTHIPESWWPHTFDIWGASHQIFHILIDVGQVVFLLGLRKVMFRQHLHVDESTVLGLLNETSLSLWIDPTIALRAGNELLSETSLSVLIESGIALWEQS